MGFYIANSVKGNELIRNCKKQERESSSRKMRWNNSRENNNNKWNVAIQTQSLYFA